MFASSGESTPWTQKVTSALSGPSWIGVPDLCLICVVKSNTIMSYGAIDPGAESRAGEGGAGVARTGDQHGGSGCRLVARFWSVAASSLPLSRRGSGGRVSTCGRRSLGDDYAQDPEQHCTGVAGLLRDQRADDERDRTTRHNGVSVGSAWTWLSGGTSVTSVSNIPLTVCSSPSSNRSIGPSSPIAYGLSASLPRRRPGAAS